MEKIIVIVRTRDEAHRIGQFCASYRDADMILVADGGSLDNTIEIARTFSNVEIQNYTGRVELQHGLWRNNDCDCVPNFLLKQDYRTILAETDKDFVLAVRLYLWGTDQHFPYMAKPEVNHVIYEPSLWAWRGSIDFWTVDAPPAYTFRIGGMPVKDLHYDAETLDLLPPYCLIHKSWDDPVRVEKKIQYYRESGFIPGMLHPMEFAGPLEPIPDFLRE